MKQLIKMQSANTQADFDQEIIGEELSKKRKLFEDLSVNQIIDLIERNKQKTAELLRRQ